MVLTPPRALRAFVCAFVVLAVGCIPKVPPVVLSTAQPVTVALVFDQEDAPAVLDVPEALSADVVALLEARNLTPELLTATDWGPDFERRRATGQRMAWLAERAHGGLVLLIETRASYYSQIEGQFRWTVSAQATFGRGDYPLDARMEVPVFLRFGHQREADAVQESRGVILRRLARLVDTALGSEDGATDAGGPSDGYGPVYFAMVDRFRNGDPSNDADADPTDPQGFHGGDLRGVIDRVPYLHELGFQTLWLSPIFAMRTAKHGPWGAYHGYWVTDPYEVEPRFGTEEDLRELIAELHARDMRLVLDFVANHVAPEADLLTEHPAWFHGLGDVQDWDDPVQAVTHDVHGLPDLAQENEEVYRWLLGAAGKWVALGVDGFRLDAVRHVSTDFWARFNDDVRGMAGDDFLLIGELFDGRPAEVARIWREGRFGQMFDFPLHYAATDVICRDAHPGRVGAMLSLDRLYDRPDLLATFADNHDLPRISSSCGEHAAAVIRLLVELRGQPVITWGTEWWLEGVDEPANRPSLPWNEPIAVTAELTQKVLADIAGVASLDDERIVFATVEGPWLMLARGYVRLDTPAGPPPSTESGSVILSCAGRPRGDLFVVGAGPELGDWNPARGVRVADAATLTFPGASVIEYKFVVHTADGVLWEDRPNRYTLVLGGQTQTVTATWNS
jgi:glycosidase